MLITNKEELLKYHKDYRIWQGIPGIEVTKKGRIFSTFYSGECDEETGNYVVLVKSDNGEDFSDPIAAVYKEDARCFDPCIWIDPLDRLWLIWSIMPNHGVYGVICDNPDEDELVWGEEFFIGHDVMMNKPTVLSTGEWIFPLSVWGERIWSIVPERRTNQKELGAFAYQSVDNGKTFQKLGGVVHPDHSFDEHQILELNDGRLALYSRTTKGIGVSYSYNRGKTWGQPDDSGFKGPASRFYIGRLKSGNVLLINHYDYKDRDNLTALISDDDCKTWKYKLLLDERDEVSYPDVKEADDGFIYITYDRERGCGKRSFDKAICQAREILYAKITEEDIMAGSLVNPKSKLKCVISKLGEYKGEPYDYASKPRYFYEYTPYYHAEGTKEALIQKLFVRNYGNTEPDVSDENYKRFDELLDAYDTSDDKNGIAYEIVRMVLYPPRRPALPFESMVRQAIIESGNYDISEQEIAEKLGFSKYYLHYRFKVRTGITVEEYRDVLKELHEAKKN